MISLIPLIPLIPLSLAGLLLHQGLRRFIMQLAPWAALPALAGALWTEPGAAVDLPRLLLGSRLGLDATAQIFLGFTSLLWTCGGVYARGSLAEEASAYRFFAFFLAAMSGNLGLILAQDMVSFYLFFTLMSFSAYGVVVHDGGGEAYRAGKVYLSLAVVGEVCLVSALLLTASVTENLQLDTIATGVGNAPTRNLIIGLTLLGFGIKVGVVPLHVYLPLIYSAAPTPASAVLSGAMIKAGLLGWLRFLPLGEIAAPGWGMLCLLAGIAAALYGIGIGLTQHDPKTALAYSSISQMGLMTVGIGVGFMSPATWPLALAAILLYALHHALAKGALFLGVGIARSVTDGFWKRCLVLVGLSLPALALAGAPFTSGAVAKLALKDAVGLSAVPAAAWLSWLLPLATVGTTLLMARFVFLVWSSTALHSVPIRPTVWLSWLASLIGGALTIWIFPSKASLDLLEKTFSAAVVWPVLAGIFILLRVWLLRRLLRPLTNICIPPGDVLVLVDWLGKQPQPQWVRFVVQTARAWRGSLGAAWRARQTQLLSKAVLLLTAEEKLKQWANAGALFLVLTAVLFALLAVATP